MEETNNNQNIKRVIIFFGIVLTIAIITFIVINRFVLKGDKPTPTPTPIPTDKPTVTPTANPITISPTPISPTSSPNSTPKVTSGDFTIDIIKQINNGNTSNYLISPYNIEIALNMLRDGALGNTKMEIDNVIGNRTIKNINIPGSVNVANGAFIKNEYKNSIKSNYINTLKNKYQSEILYDEFIKPDVINNWVKEKTNEMIPKILEEMNPNFVMGLASALAIDVKWQNEFECDRTSSGKFTKVDNSIINAQMMHNTYKVNAKYLKSDDAGGVILPFKSDSENNQLEFVGILPNSNVNSYVNNLTREKLNSLLNSEKESSNKFYIHVSLPRFIYDYSVNDFKDVLQKMGINDAFNPTNANFYNMIERKENTPDNVYVSDAIHKTHIELNEVGVKAAAITFFGMAGTGMPPKDYEEVSVKFDKPFIYMIRERNTGEILFFGAVYEPNEWNGFTCQNNNS